MALTELTAFDLPCESCSHAVTIRSHNPKQFIDDWLDGLVTVRCAIHRAR